MRLGFDAVHAGQPAQFLQHGVDAVDLLPVHPDPAAGGEVGGGLGQPGTGLIAGAGQEHHGGIGGGAVGPGGDGPAAPGQRRVVGGLALDDAGAGAVEGRQVGLRIGADQQHRAFGAVGEGQVEAAAHSFSIVHCRGCWRARAIWVTWATLVSAISWA